MAYVWTIVAPAGSTITGGTFSSGDVFRYAGNDYIVTGTPYGANYGNTTSSLNYLLANGHVTHIDGTTTAVSDPDSVIYIRSNIAGNTTYEQLATAEHSFSAVAGTSYFYGDPASSDYGIVTAVQTAQAAAFYNDLFQDPGYFTVVRAYSGNPVINQPVYQMIDVTPPAAVTLSEKVVAGFTKTVTELNANRTHIKAAEADIAGLKTRATAVEGVAAGKASIDDAALASTTSVLSAAKTMQEISDAETRAKNAAVEQIMGGVTPAELDTIKELGDALTADGSAISAINSALAKRVSTEAQTFTSGEQAQARTNIGAVSTTEMTTAINTAVTAATNATNGLLGDVGAVDIDAMFANLQTI